MIVKVVQPGGAANYSDIAAGVAYAAQKGAKVINISLGGNSDSITLKTAIATNAQASVIVAGAGNDNSEAAFYPAAYDDYVLAVAGTTNTDAKVNTSNYGTWVDVSAPGEDILTTFNNGSYGSASGTSMAVPFASGLAGLIRSQHADWFANQVRAQIIQTTDSIDAANPGLADKLGSGRINASKTATTAAVPLLTIKTYTVNGAQNGRPEPGSTVDLIVTLRNDWANAANAQATLSSGNGYVSIGTASASYGNIASFETKSNATAFRFNVSDSAPYNADLAFNLNVVGTGFNVNIPLTIPTAPGITYVHGSLNTQTWTNDRTYIVDNNAGVPAGQTLTIQPGTVVKFRDNYNLTINGTLIADGTASQQIHFTREATKTWGQIRFTNTSTPATFDGSGNYTGGSIIRNAIVEYGQCIYLDTAAPFISTSTFRDLSGCLLFVDLFGVAGNPISGLVIADNTFNGKGIGLNSLPYFGPPSGNVSILRNQLLGANIFTQATAIISGNSITSFPGSGIYAANSQAVNMVVSNNRVIDCTAGVVVNAGSINGNLVANNSQYGIHFAGSVGNMPGISRVITLENNSLASNGIAGFYLEGSGACSPIPCSLSAVIHNNNLVASPGGYAVKTNSAYTFNTDATGNYWGTTSDAAIQTAIYDGMDEFGPGIVNYSGFLSDAVQNAPAYVQNVTVQPDTTLGIQTGTFNVEFSKPMNQDTNPSAGFSSTKTGSWTTFALPDTLIGVGGGLYKVAIDKDDSKWVATSSAVGRFDGSAWTVYTSTNPISIPSTMLSGISAIAVDDSGAKWFGTAWSVFRFDDSTWTVYNCGASTFACGGSSLTGIVVDSTNAKWFGFTAPPAPGTGGGLVSFDGTTWRTYNTSNSGLPNNNVSAVAIDKDGSKWIGTSGGGVGRFDGTNWSVYNASNSGLPSNLIRALVVDQNGVKWIANANGLTSFDGVSWTTYTKIPNADLPLDSIGAIAVDSDGSKWLNYISSLVQFDGTSWTVYVYDSPATMNLISTFAIDSKNSKWVGCNSPIYLRALWGGAPYPITDNAQWTNSRTWRGTYDITSLIERGTYTITVSSAKGTDGMEIPADARFGFRVDYAGTITDKAPPKPPSVLATGAPGDPSAVSAKWTANGVAYRYAIGTAAGTADIMNWTSATGTTVSRNGLGLVSGRQYWFAVQARNAGGLWSASGYSVFVAGQQSQRQIYLPLIRK